MTNQNPEISNTMVRIFYCPVRFLEYSSGSLCVASGELGNMFHLHYSCFIFSVHHLRVRPFISAYIHSSRGVGRKIYISAFAMSTQATASWQT